ncbi:MAG: tryptophan--tRNA ligase [Bacilli bacterium]
MKKTILTGDRPSGKLHIGHYFGSIKMRVDLQYEYNTFIEIADVQALTDNFDDPSKIRTSIRELAIDYLACGIDPEYTNIFIQSKIPEIAELTIFFSNLVTVSRLFRNPTTKAEVLQKQTLFGNDGESITYGFLGYPVSQAADIAIFNADLVPVGEDQAPHLEQAREIVRKFNHIYGNTLTEPEIMISKTPRLKGLDGGTKMGKSLGNAIYLSDSEETIGKKVMNALTDPAKIKKDDKANPEICMVYYYHKLFSENELPTICKECKAGCRGCVACKKQLISNIVSYLKPIQDKRKYYEENPEIIDKVLQEGTEKAREKAKEVMMQIKTNMHIDY